MRLHLAGVMLLLAASASAQTARVSGRVVEEGRATPVSNASVRMTGGAAQVTDSLGRFQFIDVLPGRYIVTVASIGYRFRTIELTVGRDTTLDVELIRRMATLDTMLVLPRYAKVRVTAVDSASGDFLLQAQATLYPGSQFAASKRNGTITFDSVSPGPVTIIVEGLEHLPRRVEVDVTADTSFRVPMGIDSVFLRMVTHKVQQLKTRSLSAPVRVVSMNRDAIKREGTMNLGDLLRRRMFKDVRPGDRYAPCEIVDEVVMIPGVVKDLLPELIERVEIYGSPAAPSTIRVYTKRFVANLLGRETVPGVFFKGKGVTPAGCSGPMR